MQELFEEGVGITHGYHASRYKSSVEAMEDARGLKHEYLNVLDPADPINE